MQKTMQTHAAVFRTAEILQEGKIIIIVFVVYAIRNNLRSMSNYKSLI